MTTSIAPFEDIASWERALYAFLAEKQRRSGSRRTVEGYSCMLQQFFGALGKPLDQVTSQEVFVFAHGVGPSGSGAFWPSFQRSPQGCVTAPSSSR